jgi:BlaI family transcriptional regulator, penicillinase repressor
VESEPKDVSEGELAALRLLWERGPASIRQLADLLYPGGGQVQYATLQKQLERLEGKGFVHRDRALFVHVFSAAVSREELIGRRVRSVVDKLCGGSLVPLLTHLAQADELTEAERKALHDLVERRRRAKAAGDRKTPRKQ